MDRGWFVGRASKAKRKSYANAIYATSFKKTNIVFPLAWAPNDGSVYAVNVTHHYNSSAKALHDLESSLSEDVPLNCFEGSPFLDVELTKDDCDDAALMIFQAYSGMMLSTRMEEFNNRKIMYENYEMPFFYKVFGNQRPPNGYSLWISLHGGGGCPKNVNDGQYENQKRLYALEEGIYCCPRAPTNEWNLWHLPHIDKMLAILIEDFIAFEQVDPNRVYITGYSAGGDGVYKVAPRMADRFAAAMMCAGHPNGESVLGLRNLPFAIHCGNQDSAYNRNTVAVQYGETLKKLHEEDKDGYSFQTCFPDTNHWMNLNEVKIGFPWLKSKVRNPFPAKVVWKQSCVLHNDFYWLYIENPAVDQTVICQYSKQEFQFLSEVPKGLKVRLNDRIMNLDQPIIIRSADGQELLKVKNAKRTIATLVKTLLEKGDPNFMFSSEIEVSK